MCYEKYRLCDYVGSHYMSGNFCCNAFIRSAFVLADRNTCINRPSSVHARCLSAVCAGYETDFRRADRRPFAHKIRWQSASAVAGRGYCFLINPTVDIITIKQRFWGCWNLVIIHNNKKERRRFHMTYVNEVTSKHAGLTAHIVKTEKFKTVSLVFKMLAPLSKELVTKGHCFRMCFFGAPKDIRKRRIYALIWMNCTARLFHATFLKRWTARHHIQTRDS